MNAHHPRQPSIFTYWKRSSLMLLAVVLLLQGTIQHAHADGSESLTKKTQGFRANLEWRTSSYGGGKLLRRTLLKVFARQGEYVLLGSSAINVPNGQNDGDILLYAPGRVQGQIGNETLPAAADYSCAAQQRGSGNAAQGRIDSRVKELNGPRTIINPQTAAPGAENPSGYIPCFYQAPTTGIYNVVFTGPYGINSDDFVLPTGSIDYVAANYDSRQGSSVSAWDVTVRPSLTSTTEATGRLFTYYLAMFTGGNGRPVHAKMVVVSRDGYRYEVDVRGMDPNGFVLYGNQVGFLNSDGTPLYRDVLPKDGIGFNAQNQLEQLKGDVQLALPQYPIFFEAPGDETLQALNIPLDPILPQIRNFSFTGSRGGNVTDKETGGVFNFTSNVSGVFEVVISRDGNNFDPTEPTNKVLRGIRNESGVTDVNWDGRDNSGDFFPVSKSPYFAHTSIHAGEFHFPFLDVENSIAGSPVLKMLNPPDANGDGIRDGADCPPLKGGCLSGVYDDRGYITANGAVIGTGMNGSLCKNDPGIPPDPITSGALGFNSESNLRRFGFPEDGNPQQLCDSRGGFGDKKGLDLWTFYPSNELSTPLYIEDAPTAVALTSFTAQPGEKNVVLRWETRFERNTLGFHVLRSSDGTLSNAQVITPALIPGRGQSGGAVYSWVDSQATSGAVYWLRELETTGATNIYGPASVATLAANTRVWLPFVK